MPKQNNPTDLSPTVAAEATVAEISATKSYYLVNPSGTIHECDRAHAQERLVQIGWRKATPEEIVAYRATGGNQRFDRPLAPPWSPASDLEEDVT